MRPTSRKIHGQRQAEATIRAGTRRIVTVGSMTQRHALGRIATVSLMLSPAIACVPSCSRPKSEPSEGTDHSTERLVGTRSASQPRRADQENRELPSYVVLPLGKGESIVIDGRLDEPAWVTTQATRKFVHPGTGHSLSSNTTLGGTVRLRYDQESLYFGFEAEDRDVRGGFDPSQPDPHLWTRDTVELMLDPDGDGDNRDYYEIQINPQGLVFDSQFDAYNQPRKLPDGPFGHQEFNSKMRSSVVVFGTLDDARDQDRGYIVEAALPWKSLTKAAHAPPRAGDEWRANFYVMQDNAGVSWSPILGQGNFHKAARFGRLQFGD